MKIQGIDVVDADKEFEITITPTDVQLGKKKSSRECAAARALCREFKAEKALVHFSRAYVLKDEKWLRFSVRPALRSEIVAFDRGGEFAPGDYVLGRVEKSHRRETHAPSRGKKYQNHGTKPHTGNRPKRPYHTVVGVRERMAPE